MDKTKTVKAYSNLMSPERDLVEIYKKYISLRPRECDDKFYLQPLKKPSLQTWYSIQHVGINKISKIIQNMCSKSGFTGKFTTHSLRATTATRLFEEDVNDQLIMEVTGHRSNAVRVYKRTSDEKKAEISAII